MNADRRRELEAVFRSAVDAVDPARVVPAALERLPPPARDPHLFALGKAAPAMARAAAAWLHRQGRGVAGGVVAHGGDATADPGLSQLAWVAGDHPVPGDRSAEAAAAVGEAAGLVQDDDEVLVLVSGGTSSLIAAPAPGAGTSDLAALFGALLDSGTDIRAMNAVRRRALRWGGGRLAEALGRAELRCVVLSDVPGGGPHDVGSGPCDQPWVRTVVAADNRTAVLAAVAAARSRGWDAAPACEELRGEAAGCGRRLASRLTALAGTGSGDVARCLVWGGETAVRLAGARGTGGRSQELALAASEALAGAGGGRVTLLAAGTDGRDGPTDAAGAVVGGPSWTAIAAAGLDPALHLARHDAYPALEAIGALIRTGPTGTNVADLAIGLVAPA